MSSTSDETQSNEQSNQAKNYSDHNLIVNYLPQSTTNEELATLFSSVGPVKMAKVIRNRVTGISYGFGFVEFENESDAQKAIDALNGLQLQNKRIKVAIARQGENIKGANLYIRYLPKNFFPRDLEELFGPYGNIVQARVLMDNITGLSRGIGFVLFSSRDEATRAKEALDGKAPPGHTQALSIKFAEENKMVKQPQAMPFIPPGGAFQPYMPILPGVASIPSAVPMGSPMPTPVARPPPMQRPPGPFVDGFGEGYQNNFGGGPLRSSLMTQRFNPMPYRPVVPPAVPPTQTPDANGAGAVATNPDGYVLFVYNIGTNTDERSLWQLFSPYGSIKKVNVVRDFEKQQGKGYGFVTMFDYQEALCAIQQLNGFVYVDKPLQVSLKCPKAGK